MAVRFGGRGKSGSVADHRNGAADDDEASHRPGSNGSGQGIRVLVEQQRKQWSLFAAHQDTVSEHSLKLQEVERGSRDLANAEPRHAARRLASA